MKDKVVALTPARGGSKSIKYKNLVELGGKPLIAWPIQSALEIPEIKEIIVSTENKLIADCAIKYGAKVDWRPEELAGDRSLVIDVIREFWSRYKKQNPDAEIIVLLEATCPFRTKEMIQKCINRLVNENLDSIATFHTADLNPERAWRVSDSGIPEPFIKGAIPWKPRQLLSPAYQLNGAVYCFRPDKLPENAPNILFGKLGAEIIDNHSVIDIDTKKDFIVANALLNS
ncbi:acylneuraminate cytidylyltransferase family protein [Rhodospirillaceae bacterium RKSG073]|nr:acylneuraminate cytidylyltransferase family protein [Curvivirga aplysinae]